MKIRRPALALAGLAVVATACGGGGGGGSAESFCDDAEGLNERFEALDDMDMPDASTFAEVRDALDELTPPDEIADDYNTVKDAISRFTEVFEDFDPENPDMAILEELQGLEEEMGNLEAASANVEAYLNDECGIDTSG